MAKNNKNVSVDAADKPVKHGWIWTLGFTVLALFFIFPIFEVVINSFKETSAIGGTDTFILPTKETFSGLVNYVQGIADTNFWSAFGNTVLITVLSVLAIIICTSMCGWYIARVDSKGTKLIYFLYAFSMVIPFQMVMYTLAYVAQNLNLTSPIGLVPVYLGFGAGLATFMFVGFAKSIPLEIEEAAMIDGCGACGIFFRIVLPIMKPTYITVAILEAMWIWNDYLLPYLVLDSDYKTVPIAIQFLQTSHGQVEWGPMMAIIILAIIPIIIFYAICQKYIIGGVVAGAVKG
jgi:raffinose/stachyose/melibiose transport system permease protein